jgi:hypothetical protein
MMGNEAIGVDFEVTEPDLLVTVFPVLPALRMLLNPLYQVSSCLVPKKSSRNILVALSSFTNIIDDLRKASLA